MHPQIVAAIITFVGAIVAAIVASVWGKASEQNGGRRNLAIASLVLVSFSVVLIIAWGLSPKPTGPSWLSRSSEERQLSVADSSKTPISPSRMEWQLSIAPPSNTPTSPSGEEPQLSIADPSKTPTLPSGKEPQLSIADGSTATARSGEGRELPITDPAKTGEQKRAGAGLGESFAEFAKVRDRVESTGSLTEKRDFIRKWQGAHIRWEGYVDRISLSDKAEVDWIVIRPGKTKDYKLKTLLIQKPDTSHPDVRVFENVREGDKVMVEGEIGGPLSFTNVESLEHIARGD